MKSIRSMSAEEKKKLVRQLFLSVESDHEWRTLLDGVIEQLKIANEYTDNEGFELASKKLEAVKLIINGGI